MYNIDEYAKLLGVSKSTLRRWEKEGKISSFKTKGGHRRYSLSSQNTDIKKTIAYARVSTHDQKDDLIRQKQVLELYCSSKGYTFEVIEDLGSGLNYNKKGLKKLLKLINDKQIERLVLTNNDRLLRFGKEIIFELCSLNNISVEIINKSENTDSNTEFVNDVLEVITHFSSKLYGQRSHKNKHIIETNKNLFNI